jgi:ATP-binding cassette subfamily B multidrug efflux pump
MCVGGIILALNQNVPLSSLLLVAVPLLAIILALIIRRMRPLFRQMQERLDSINGVLREQITGVRVIRAFVRDPQERERFAGASNQLFDVSLGAGKLMALMYPSVLLVLNLSTTAVVWFGGHLVADGTMQIGSLTAFITYLAQILTSVMMATFMFMLVPRAEVSAERIMEVIDTEPGVAAPASPQPAGPQPGRLELRNVGFRFPGAEQPVLHDISLTALPERTTAIIGGTGSGKTTLVNLIPRLLDVTAGSLLVGGVDVRELDPAQLSAAVGLVPQKPYLFSGTVATNLRYGNQQATDEDLWHALEIAQARDFVERMPDGLDSRIAQGGTNVSGGQRQRLAIARALVRKPQIYLFDDSFSALDYATDARLRSALATQVAGATMIIVAQRVATIRHADQILVLDAGRIVARGTHAELMESSETYREIVLSQLTEQEAAA